MGIWVAVGLAFSWVIVFTLFPALQKLLRTPTRDERRTAGARLRAPRRAAARLDATAGAGRSCAAALGLSLLGRGRRSSACPASSPPMADPHGPGRVPRPDVRALPRHPPARAADARARGDARLAARPARQRRRARGADGAAPLPAGARGRSRGRGRGRADLDPAPGALPRRAPATAGRRIPPAQEALAADLEALLPVEPMLAALRAAPRPGRRRRSRSSRAPPSTRPSCGSKPRCAATGRRRRPPSPRWRRFEMRPVGLAPLQARVAQELVPTLVESFTLTVAIIFARVPARLPERHARGCWR